MLIEQNFSVTLEISDISYIFLGQEISTGEECRFEAHIQKQSFVIMYIKSYILVSN